jgi:YlxR-like protein
VSRDGGSRGTSSAAELALSRSDSPRSKDVRIDPPPSGLVLDGPVRMCRNCRARKPKQELTRWVGEGAQAVRDEAQRLPGRGYYTCTEPCARSPRKQAALKK